ncbi:hypothetical protein [Mesorhizobium sp. LSJC264A00]|uniref:hypothetical protein n=1 Tax=unclassified Mesorhizobium TaxID=325217 RepID=UPI0012EB417F|nr:hypothetical protein [Mesorhizobium sp. LSJC264A00]
MTALGLAAVMLAATGVGASSQTVSVQSVYAASPSVEITSDRREVSAPFRIANTGTIALTVSVVAQPIASQKPIACGEGKPDCTLGWIVKGQRLSPGVPRDVSIPPFEVVDLTLEGVAGLLGTYTATLIVGPSTANPDVKSATYTVKLTRKMVSLGSDAVQFGPGGTRTRGIGGSLRPLTLSLVNKSETAVDITKPLQVLLSRDDGGGTYSLDEGVVTPSCSVGEGQLRLEPGEAVACSVALPDFLSAPSGRYRADIRVEQPGIEAVTASREFTIRQQWLYAFVLLLASSIFGAWLAGWQNSGRRRALEAADALTLKASFLDIIKATGGPLVGPKGGVLVRTIVTEIDRMVVSLETQSDASFASQLDALAARLPLVGRFVELEKQLGQNPPQPAYDSAYAAVSQASPPADAGAKLDTLESALANAGARMAPVPGLDGTSQFFFRFRAKSPAWLRALVRSIDRAILLLAILLVSLTGMLTLWQPNSTWGDGGDILTAMLTGIAATATGSLGLLQLTSGYTLAKIGK